MSFEGNEYDKDVDGRVIHGHGFKPRRPFFFFFFTPFMALAACTMPKVAP